MIKAKSTTNRGTFLLFTKVLSQGSCRHQQESLNTDNDIESNVSDIITAPRIKYNPNQEWFTKGDMKKGEAYVFYTGQTPHAAVEDPEQEQERNSVEIRFAVVRKNKQ